MSLVGNIFFLFKELFLSDLSPIIGYACHSLTNSLTHCCLVNLTDVSLACEDANSKLVEVVIVTDVHSDSFVQLFAADVWLRL